MSNYDFPVELQNVYLKNGEVVPRARAVVRTDTGQPLSTVGSKYQLVPHQDMVDKAEGFMSVFGNPTRQFSLAKNGGLMIGTYTFKDNSLEVAKGDIIGLRIYLESAYLGTRKNRIRVGALRLTCLNGATFAEAVFDLAFSHTQKQVESFIFPKPDDVVERFTAGVARYKEYNTIELSSSDYKRISEDAITSGVVPAAAIAHEARDLPEGLTAWRLYNQLTWFVNHESKAGYVGKVNRLERIDRFFHETFTA